MPVMRVPPQTLLAELATAEGAGAEALGQWTEACDDPALRGGLRVIQARDAAHARLAARRLAALGAEPQGTVGRHLAQLCGVLAAPDVSNRSKLAILLARFPPRGDDRADALLHELDDDETRALLVTIRDDDHASMRWLHEAVEGSGAAAPAGGAEPAAPILRFLDAFRAAEAANAEVFRAWHAVCPLPGLRGGLDTIGEREATHAALLGERLHELGGEPRAAVPADLLARALAHVGARDVADEAKLELLAARYPEEEAAAHPAQRAADELAPDLETREMLRLVAAGEAATFAWLRSYRRAMTERPREVSLRVLDGGR